MKKTVLFTCLLAILMVSLCLPVGATGTQQTATITLHADKSTPARGETVTVTVSLAGSAKAKSMMIEPMYDTSVLELQSGEWLLTGGMLTEDWSAEFGDAAIAYSAEADVNGDIFKLTFKVLDAAAIGNTQVNCHVIIKNGQTEIENTVTPIDMDVLSQPPADTDIGATDAIQPNGAQPAPGEQNNTAGILQSGCASTVRVDTVLLLLPILAGMAWLLKRKENNNA